MGIVRYLKVDKWRLDVLHGDPAAMFWYQALLDYSKRFKPDKLGYIRISRQTVMSDYGFSRTQIQHLNRKLCDAKLINIDMVRRGNRTPTGYRML
jgi:hypothetical protein